MRTLTFQFYSSLQNMGPIIQLLQPWYTSLSLHLSCTKLFPPSVTLISLNSLWYWWLNCINVIYSKNAVSSPNFTDTHCYFASVHLKRSFHLNTTMWIWKCCRCILWAFICMILWMSDWMFEDTASYFGISDNYYDDRKYTSVWSTLSSWIPHSAP